MGYLMEKESGFNGGEFGTERGTTAREKDCTLGSIKMEMFTSTTTNTGRNTAIKRLYGEAEVFTSGTTMKMN